MSDIRVLMTTKYLENLHRDGPLSKYSIANFFFAPGSPHDSKMPFEQLFLDDPISTGCFTQTATKEIDTVSDLNESAKKRK